HQRRHVDGDHRCHARAVTLGAVPLPQSLAEADMSMRAWTVHLFRGRWDEEMCRVDAGSFRGVVRHAEAGDWELDAPVAGIGIPEHQVEQVGSVLVREGARTVFAGVVTPPTGKTLYSEG